MANNSQDYYFRMFAELYGKDNISAIAAGIGDAAAKAKQAKAETDMWAKAMEVAADKAGVSVKELTAQIRAKIREQERDKRMLEEYNRLQTKAAEDARKNADRELKAMREQTEEAKKLAHAKLEAWLAGTNQRVGGGAAGFAGGRGAGGVSGGTESTLGAVGGRVFGATVGALAGIPGSGFIGSQLAQSAGAGTTLLGAGLGIFSAVQLTEYINNTAKWAQEQRNLAREMGVTSAQMATVSRVANTLGVDLRGSVQEVSNLGSAMADGGDKARRIEHALKALGLTTTTAFKGTGDAFNDIVGALSKVGDSAARTRLAVDLLGDSGRGLAAAIRDMPELAAKFGIKDEEIDRLAKVRDIIGEITEDLKEHFAYAFNFVFGSLLQEPRPKDPVDKFKGYVGPLDTTGGIKLDVGRIEQMQGQGRTRGGITLDPSKTFEMLDSKIPADLDFEKPKVLGKLDPADVKKKNTDYYRETLKTLGTMEERFQAKISDINRRREDAKKSFTKDLTLNPQMFDSRMKDLSREEEAARNQYRYEQQVRSQLDSLRKETEAPAEGAMELVQKLKKLRSSSFGLIFDTPQYQNYVNKLKRALVSPTVQGEAFDPMTRTFINPDDRGRDRRITGVGPLQTGRSPLDMFSLQGLNFDFETGRFKFEDEARENMAQVSRRGFEFSIQRRQHLMQEFQEAERVVSARRQMEADRERVQAQQVSAISMGTSRYGFTQPQLEKFEFEMQQAALARETTPEIRSLRDRAAMAELVAQEFERINPGGPEAEIKRLEADRMLVEAVNAEADARTRSIEITNRFNESIDKAAEAIRDDFSGGVVSIMMGAQQGARTGRAGQGAVDALRGYAEKIESQILQNIIGKVVYQDPKSGAGGVLSKIGGALPPWMVKGTIFENLNERVKNPELVDNTKSQDKNTVAVEKLTKAIVESKILYAGEAGGPEISGGSLRPYIGEDLPNVAPPSFKKEMDRALGVVDSISGVASAVKSGGSNGGIIKAVETGISKLTSGTALAGIGAGIGLTGTKAIDALTGKIGATNAVKAGAAIGVAGAGFGAYEGIANMTKGDAKNVSGGLAMTLGSIAPFTGPAAPFVAGAAAVAGLVSAFIPDNRIRRQREIEKRMFLNQYNAPEAISLSRSTGGGYADFDMRGEMRESTLSPYPQRHFAYLDWNRRTVVPGSTTQEFGGPYDYASSRTFVSAQREAVGATMMKPVAPVREPVYRYQPSQDQAPPQKPQQNVTIQYNITVPVKAMDSKSFLDRATDIVDAFHKGVKETGHPVINEIAQQMGTR